MQKTQIMFILSLIFAIFVAIFALTNSNSVVVNLFFYEFTATQAIIIFISAALGAIIVTLLGLVNHLKLKGQLKTLRKANEELNAKVQSLTEDTKEIKTEKTEAAADNVENTESIDNIDNIEDIDSIDEIIKQ